MFLLLHTDVVLIPNNGFLYPSVLEAQCVLQLVWAFQIVFGQCIREYGVAKGILELELRVALDLWNGA